MFTLSVVPTDAIESLVCSTIISVVTLLLVLPAPSSSRIEIVRVA